MSNLVDKGYVELVPKGDIQRADGAVWYLPHHPVHNPRKPDKLRVVFDCAATYNGTSLNDHVLQGPDLTNKLLGVLLRFRREPIELMADIQEMFHQVKVPLEDRDFLRYLWWPGGDFNMRPEVYRMTAHLFGGTWSPSCCNYVLRHTATEKEISTSPGTNNTVLGNFYVDDCLTSTETEEEAIVLTKELETLLH
ncbi:hypothetical protein BSL78_26812 [Apostichopus japonicus]|uniref:Reverse transcriptase domain-containing protein n=1 Tax=Stichopus japonicus TaxID=307972 RepID=A0A2G8JKU8_STIJA|nr:hypothetical protein BSL78_26812 [Apostichopus japonicus]